MKTVICSVGASDLDYGAQTHSTTSLKNKPIFKKQGYLERIALHIYRPIL